MINANFQNNLTIIQGIDLKENHYLLIYICNLTKVPLKIFL